MLWAAVTLCFFVFLRSGEVTIHSDHSFDPAAHITFSDISVDHIQDPQSVKLRLKASKTDPFRRGVDIIVGKTNNKLCPVSALLAYMAIRGSKPGFLSHFEDGRLLTKKRFVNAVREALSSTQKITRAIPFVLGLLQRQEHAALLTLPSRCSADGRALLI